MKRALSTICIVLLSTVSLYACGDDDDDLPSNNGSGGSGGKAGTGGKSGAGGAGGGASGTGGSAGTAGGGAGTAGSGAGSGGTAGGGAGTAGASGAAGAAGAGGDAGASGAAGQGGGTLCSAARDKMLIPIDKVSEGKVFVTTVTEGGSGGAGGGAGSAGAGGSAGAAGSGNSFPAVFVDASAGGFGQSSVNPRIYISLTVPERVNITDPASFSSVDWDLSLERSVVYANSGDGGPGGRTVAFVVKPFAEVTAADATGVTFAAESFFDAECNPKTDQLGGPLTTFSDWYDYNQPNNVVSPKVPERTYLVRRGDGTTFKVGFVSFYTNNEGVPQTPPSSQSGKYLLRIAPL